MAVQFKKLLPALMRNTRWGDLVDVCQNIDNQIRQEKIAPIFNRFTKDDSTAAELVALGTLLGFKISSFTGTYTATLEYLRREVSTIVSRISHKNSRKAYQYTSYIYNLYNELYPIITNSSGQLSGKLTTLYDTENQVIYAVIISDQEGDNSYYDRLVDNWETDTNDYNTDENLISDYTTTVYGDPQTTGLQEAFTDTDSALETDQTSSSSSSTSSKGDMITQTTRNILYSYYHKFLETPSEWMTLYTLKALKNDMNQIHKATEVIYYEPWVQLETSSISGEISSKTYYNYDFSVSGEVHSVFKGSSLLAAQYIQFGTGSHYTTLSGIPENISGVQIPSYCIPSGVVSGVVYCGSVPSGVAGWSLYEDATSSSLDFDMILSEYNKFTAFTEIALLNSTSGCMYYATFPKIQWDSSMSNNIRIKINLV